MDDSVRSSNTSHLLARKESETLETPSRSLRDAHEHQERYICPFCNMGIGRIKRRYTNHPATPKYTADFQMIKYFDTHIIERHSALFLRDNSTELICDFCPCDAVKNQHPTCSATFTHLQPLLEHLRSAHARDPEHLKRFWHRCAPISITSYTSTSVQETAIALFSDSNPT
jgi:hypothetical protein